MSVGEQSTVNEPASGREAMRAQIVEAAAELLATGGREAVSTRAVATAAGTQAPTIYRLFGDKDGLLEAVAEYGYNAYLAAKPRPRRAADPVKDLRAGWDLHLEFGLANPALFTLMYGDPDPQRRSPAAAAGLDILRTRIRAIAAVGRLRVDEDLAVDLVHAAGCGTVLTVLAKPAEQRHKALSDAAYAAVVAAITVPATDAVTAGAVPAANALRAQLGHVTALTTGERRLLDEWLQRIAAD